MTYDEAIAEARRMNGFLMARPHWHWVYLRSDSRGLIIVDEDRELQTRYRSTKADRAATDWFKVLL